ncbi:unnamed protein product [Cladocopium goreaui]|uniref:F-box/LRR-repeat protein 4 n=1 Tax=Cladocopium goreaui TaxID=2562237 RepID=A0A9P1DM65_9DINO|nr:unnamed protein product [Cladocopium goreaui]
MATAAVTVPGGAGASGVIPCPLPATVEDAICAVQKTQPGEPCQTWLGECRAFPGVQYLKPGTALEAAAYTLVSYDTLGSSAINVPQTECRGINLKQLSQLVDFIRDHAHLCVETCSFVELVAKDAETQFPCWFVSHAWQEAVCRFVACLRQHAELRNAAGLAYWVCAYANNQHKLQDEISANPRGTSFYKAMKLAVGVVLILDQDVEERNTGTPLLLDVAATDSSNEAHVITDGLAAPEARLMPLLGFLAKALREANFPTLLAQKGLSVDISKADASKAEDKIRILNCIRLPQARTKELTDVAPLQDPNYSAVNKALAAHFAIASWFGAVTQGQDTSNLRRALAADSSRHMVELSFTGCRGFGDDSLQQLLNHLPRKLRLLRLDLAFTGVQSWNFQKEMPPLEQLTLRFTGSRLADASGLAQMLDTEQCLALSLKSLQLWFSNLPSLVELGSWEPLTKLQLEELVLQLKRCGQVPPEAKQSLILRCIHCHIVTLEVELAGSKAVDYVDFDDAIDDSGGRAPFPCSHSRCHEFHENVHGFCPKHRLLRHCWKLASWWRTAWRWAELSLLFTLQAAAEIQQRTTLAVILLSLYPVACLSLEESLGVPWAAICTLLSVIVLSSIVTTSIRFDTVRAQILQEAVATEASYSQVPCSNPSSVCSFTRCMMYVNVCLFERFLTRLSPIRIRVGQSKAKPRKPRETRTP